MGFGDSVAGHRGYRSSSFDSAQLLQHWSARRALEHMSHQLAHSSSSHRDAAQDGEDRATRTCLACKVQAACVSRGLVKGEERLFHARVLGGARPQPVPPPLPTVVPVRLARVRRDVRGAVGTGARTGIMVCCEASLRGVHAAVGGCNRANAEKQSGCLAPSAPNALRRKHTAPRASFVPRKWRQWLPPSR